MTVPDDLVERAAGLVPSTGRAILGIAGSPGAGKTTLARELAERLGECASYLPMDGFHLANTTLDRLGRHGRKGAIDTFDGWGYLALLRRILDETGDTVYAPAFDRAVDEPVAGAIPIEPRVRIVVTEGNYLLIDRRPWNLVSSLLVESWFCETAQDVRFERLVERHVRHGRTPEAAAAWALEIDGANASLIEASASRADLVVRF